MKKIIKNIKNEISVADPVVVSAIIAGILFAAGTVCGIIAVL